MCVYSPEQLRRCSAFALAEHVQSHLVQNAMNNDKNEKFARLALFIPLEQLHVYNFAARDLLCHW